ncbi:MAG TPA: SagB/ThcOx family dehydrogenase [bacterium]|nr:SagB/ThcOx family dehydrogenase [bacterium]
MEKSRIEQYRDFLKSIAWKQVDFSATDQNRGAPVPPIEKPFAPDAKRMELPRPQDPEALWEFGRGTDLAAAIANRCSRRSYRREPLTLEGLSFLLWATQGVRGKVTAGHAYRNVPSGGCRHALETYLAVLNVTGLEQGVYRYLPLSHQLVFEFAEASLEARLVEATLGQAFVAKAAVTFVWAAIPYRMEWRYSLAAHKVIAIDAGHVCQNLYLACEAIGAGTCAIAAYDQEALDRLLRLDGTDEFVIYLAPVGKR